MKNALKDWPRIVLTMIMIVTALAGAARVFVTKSDLKNDQESQEKYLCVYIKQAANEAADNAVEKWIALSKK